MRTPRSSVQFHRYTKYRAAVWTSLLPFLLIPSFLLTSNSAIQVQISPQPTLTETSSPTLSATSTPGNPIINVAQIGQVAELQSWQAHTEFVEGIDFSPDQTHLVTTGHDPINGSNPIRLWDLQGNTLIELEFEGIQPFASATTVHFSQDGQYIVTSLGINSTIVWNVSNGTQVAQIGQGAIDTVFADSSNIIIAREDGLIGIWNISLSPSSNTQGQEAVNMGVPTETLVTSQSEILVTAFQIGEPVRGVAFSPNTRKVFVLGQSGNLNIFTWEVINGTLQTVKQEPQATPAKPLPGLTGPRIALKPSSSWVAYTASPQDIVIYDYLQETSVAHYNLDTPISCMMFSPNGEILIVADQAEASSIHIFDADTGELLVMLPTQGTVTSCAFNTSGTLFATGNSDGEITIWGIP